MNHLKSPFIIHFIFKTLFQNFYSNHPCSPTHDKSRPIAEEEEEIVPSAEEIESPATASIGKVLEELPSPMKKPKRVKVIKKADLLPQEPEPDILLSKRRITRTSIRTDLDNKKPEDLLDDPIKLLNSVLKVQEVDHETKLDLFLCKIFSLRN